MENIIFRNLSLPALGICSRVCKVWREIAEKQINTFSHEKAFGPKEWFIHFGTHLRNVPRLPPQVAEILFSSCPFWPSRKVHETHLLVLVPETVGGQPLTLKILGELVKKPLQGPSTQYSHFHLGQYTDPVAPSSHWVLMTRDVIEGSRSKSYPDQQTLLSQKGHDVYVVPNILDATVCIFMEHIRSGTQLDGDSLWTCICKYVQSATRLYGDSPWTYTRCQEKYDTDWQLVVGGFAPFGLYVNYGRVNKNIGVGGVRKFLGT
jgi:hypothetical protein